MNPPDDLRAQRARIRALQRKLQLPPFDPVPARDLDSVERTLRYLTTIEEEPVSTYSRQLITDGIALPAPESLDPDETDKVLREVLIGLARRHAFLHHTNHLSNRELYRHLWERTLNEPVHELDDSMGDCANHIDLAGDGSEESEHLYLQYYADDFEREQWQEEFPHESLPQHRKPPYNRDRCLPQTHAQFAENSEESIIPEPARTIAYRHLPAAKDYFNLGNYKLAHAELDRAEECPDLFGSVTLIRMEILMHEGRWKEACRCGEILCGRNPENPDFFINYAHSLYKSGNALRALEVLDSGPDSMHKIANYHYNRGTYELLMGGGDIAVQYIKLAFAMDSKYRRLAEVDPGVAPIRHRLLEE